MSLLFRVAVGAILAVGAGSDRIVAGSYCLADADRDGVCDPMDNCPRGYNPVQRDGDGDGVGDFCDNCVDLFNPDQRRTHRSTDGVCLVGLILTWCFHEAGEPWRQSPRPHALPWSRSAGSWSWCC